MFRASRALSRETSASSGKREITKCEECRTTRLILEARGRMLEEPDREALGRGGVCRAAILSLRPMTITTHRPQSRCRRLVAFLGLADQEEGRKRGPGWDPRLRPRVSGAERACPVPIRRASPFMFT